MKIQEWKELIGGNRLITTGGYVIIYCPEHPHAKPNGYVFEHRLVIENKIQRFLKKYEHVHHKNGNPSDNEPENLEIIKTSDHAKLHLSRLTRLQLSERAQGLVAYAKSRKFQREEVKCACGCGRKFITPDAKGRYHSYLVGHNARGKHWKWDHGNI